MIAVVTVHSRYRHSSVVVRERAGRRDQGRHRRAGHRLRGLLRRRLRTGSRSSRRTPANGASTAGAAFCAPRASSSSPTSASTRYRRPRRKRRIRSATSPSAFSGSLIVCTILYVLMSAVLTGMLHYPKLNDAAPVAAALEAHPSLLWLTIPVIIGAVAGLTSVILVMMLAQSRIFYSMSRDGLLPHAFRACHPQWKTPVFSTVLTGVCAGRWRPVSDRHSWRTGVDRHADGLHHCLHRRAGIAQDSPGSAAAVPRSVALVHLPRRRDFLRRPWRSVCPEIPGCGC